MAMIKMIIMQLIVMSLQIKIVQQQLITANSGAGAVASRHGR